MKIKIMIGLVLLIFLGSALWANRSEILLAYVKHKTDTEFLVGPNTVPALRLAAVDLRQSPNPS